MRLLATGLALAAMCAESGAATSTSAAKQCSLTVTFSSYAMGIDQRTYSAVDALLSRDPRVVGLERKYWGREGEVTLCAQTRRNAEAQRLFAQVKKLFPARPRGPLSVSTATGSKFETPTRK